MCCNDGSVATVSVCLVYPPSVDGNVTAQVASETGHIMPVVAAKTHRMGTTAKLDDVSGYVERGNAGYMLCQCHDRLHTFVGLIAGRRSVLWHGSFTRLPSDCLGHKRLPSQAGAFLVILSFAISLGVRMSLAFLLGVDSRCSDDRARGLSSPRWLLNCWVPLFRSRVSWQSTFCRLSQCRLAASGEPFHDDAVATPEV